jgi:hypothetical protein
VLNGPQAMNAASNDVDILAPNGDLVEHFSGTKEKVAVNIFQVIQRRLIDGPLDL